LFIISLFILHCSLIIELAPSHKTGLTLAGPVLAGGGAMGFADECAGLIDFSKLGAFITNPITYRPRTPAEGVRVVPVAGGTLVHTGLPNPGLSAALRDYERKWARLGCPLVLHLAATTPGETITAVERLERIDTVAGIELGFRDDAPLAEVEPILRDCVQRARQPIIASLPQARAAVFARLAHKLGAQAVTVAAPPRGMAWVNGELVKGRLYGASLLPHTLRLIDEIHSLVPLPIIGAGGIHTQADVDAVLEAGAVAAMVDSAVWVLATGNNLAG
jgi:dihydroorotate dehydrogenase (NAD+) catalytic subunit